MMMIFRMKVQNKNEQKQESFEVFGLIKNHIRKKNFRDNAFHCMEK